jgi:uncharacterized membrane protein YvbJ
MKSCPNCNAQLADNAILCPHCGTAFSVAPAVAAATDDASSAGFGVLSFFVPVVGLILYILWHDATPKKAKSCIIGAIAGFVTYFVFMLIVGLLFVLMLLYMSEGFFY